METINNSEIKRIDEITKANSYLQRSKIQTSST